MGKGGVSVYSLADTARILRVSPARLRYWERTALVQPSCDESGRPAFAFGDLVAVRSLLALIADGLSVRRIRLSVDGLRRHLPAEEQPLRALRSWGPRQVVARHAGGLIQPDGQLVLDFGAASVQPPVEALPAGEGAPSEEGAPRPAPQNAWEWFERGCELDADPGTFAEAAAAYRRALALDPAFADAWCNLGTVHFNAGRRAEAQHCYEKTLQVERLHVEANFNLANLLEERGRRESALHHYKAAVCADPSFSDAHLNLALLYEKLDLHRTARDSWQRYLKLVPTGSWADLARKRLRE